MHDTLWASPSPSSTNPNIVYYKLLATSSMGPRSAHSLTAAWSATLMLMIVGLSLSPRATAQPTAQQIVGGFISSIPTSCRQAIPKSWTAATPFPKWEGNPVTVENTVVTSINFWDYGLCGPLPVSFSQLTGLTYLDMKENNFSSTLPPQWSTLRKLVELRMYTNLLTGSLPPAWAAMKSLAGIELKNNRITGSLPSEWGRLANLQLLDIMNNSIQGTLPHDYSSLTSLNALSLRINILSGSLPATWSTLKQLQFFDLFNNTFSGSLPTQFSELTGLRRLDLSSNRLSGPLPAAWSTLTDLELLDLNSNGGVKGPLPPEWSTLQMLTHLDLSNNMVDGSLPTEWIAGLYVVHLWNNSLQGPLPPGLTKLQSLSHLSLGYNNFSGSLPTEWKNLRGLTLLDIGRNNIKGPIPPSWNLTKWTSLEYLDLAGNMLTGPLQPLPKSLKYCHAANNSLSGPVPPIPLSLVYLDVANNKLTGAIPAVSNKSSLAYLNVDNNSLSHLPRTFNGPNATYLSASGNMLEGLLPGPAAFNHSLVYCDLSRNRLHGPIPSSWSERAWKYLALDSNQLSGTLPDTWTGAVAVLLLQNNTFHGCLPTSWLHNASAQILSFAVNQFSCVPESWGTPAPVSKGKKSSTSRQPSINITTSSFAHLSVLDVSNNTAKSVPLSWVRKGAFNSDPANRTILLLGDIWVKAAKGSRRWKKAVCIDKSLNTQLLGLLERDQVGETTRKDIQTSLNAALSQLIDTLTPLGNSAFVFTGRSFQLDSLPLRLSNSTRSTRDEVCDSPHAELIVMIQWLIVGGLIILMLALYCIEVRWKLVSKLVSKLLQNITGRAERAHQYLIRNQNQRMEGITTATGPLKWMSRLGCIKYAVTCVMYWFDVVTDILLMRQVWGFWPSYVLLSLVLLNYAVGVGLLMWRLDTIKPAFRVALCVLCLPLMPLLDTAVFVVLALRAAWPSNVNVRWVHWVEVTMQWKAVFEMREVVEASVEALPTMVMQSVVFLLGNRPSIGWYLDETLYLFSCVGSSLQLLRLLGIILLQAAGDGLTPWTVVKRKMLDVNRSEREEGQWRADL